MPTAAGHRVIGIKYFAKGLRMDGLLAPGQYFPDEAVDRRRDRGAARVQRWVNRILRDVATAMRSQKLSQRLRNGEIQVRVGNETVPVKIEVPTVVLALQKKLKHSRRH
jgi:hypothetical protein